LHDLSKKDKDLEEVQAIGIDGFHFPQAYLEKTTIPIDGYEVLMKEVKGSPETFDFNQLKKKIMALKEEQTEIKWPIYDRKKHDVIPEQISIEKNIVVLEGNWLLLNEENWKDLSDYCDYSLFISAKEDLLRERLIERKMRGGLSEAEALNFYDRSDRKNIERVLNNKLEANLELEVSNNGKYSIGR
jgi:pantothenate kinase